MKKILQLFSKQALLLCLVLISSMSWGQTSTYFNFGGTSGYLATPASGWTSSGTEGGSYLKLSPGSVTSPEYVASNNVVFKYDIGSFGSGSSTDTKLLILNSANVLIQEFTLHSTSGGGTYTKAQTINVGSVLSTFKVKIQGFGNGSTVRGTRLQNFSLVGEIAPPANLVPIVSNVSISGLPNTTVELTGIYDYADAESDADASTYKWYTATDAVGTNATAIDGATSTTFTLTTNELAKYIRFGVLAASSTGTSPGDESFSSWIGPVNAAGSPVLNASILSDFDPTCINTSGVEQTLAVSGINLTAAAITVGPLSGFTFSTDNGITYTAQATLTADVSGDLLAAVLVKFSPVLAASYDGDIVIEGGGANAIVTRVEALGINTPVSLSSATATDLNAVSALINADLIEGCSEITAYGILYSVVENFEISSGNTVFSTNLNTGSFTVALNGLQSNTTYYYRTFATDATATVYGTQSSFATTALAAPIATAGTFVGTTNFTANWNAVAGATGYELDVYTVDAVDNATDLFISEYVEGSSNNKYIEIFNGTGSEIDLSDYKINLYTNGASAASSTLVLSGLLANGGTLVFRNGQSVDDTIGVVSSIVNYNGDDAIAIVKGLPETFVDIFGVIGNDPGTKWTSGVFETVNQTLRRKASVTSGITANPSGTGPSAFITLGTEWDKFEIDNLDDLGSHTFSGGTTTTYLIQNQSVGNVTSYEVSGLNPNTHYFYVVRAVNGTASSNSNEIEVTTAAPSAITWNGALWSNTTGPDATLDAVIDGNYNETANITAKNLTVAAGVVVTVAPTSVLTVSGDLVNNGTLVFESTAAGTASFAPYNGAPISGTGTATVERYIPAKRAWRFLTAPLLGTSNNALVANWQGVAEEGALLFAPATYQSQTMTGYAVGGIAPNIFKYNTGWQAIPDLTSEIMFGATANDTQAYQIFVTGASNSTNIATGAAATTLRPKGTLITGTVNHVLTANAYKLLPNPYASPIDTEAMVANNAGAKVWLLEPSIGLGAYVTYDGANWSAPTTGNDKNIQSGQGFFVKTTNTSFAIEEGLKVTGNSNTWFVRNATVSNDTKIRVLLYKQNATDWQLADAILAVNSMNGNTAVDAADASKISNYNESLMFRNGTSNLAIEYRGVPQVNEIQAMRLTGTSATPYQLRIYVESFIENSLVPLLEDTLLGTFTTIPTDGSTVTVPFTGVVSNTTNPDDRFRMVYQTALSNDSFETLKVSVYPNPVSNGTLSINIPQGEDAAFELYNVLGQKVQQGILAATNNSVNVSRLQSGVYVLNIEQSGKKFTTKVIVDAN